MVDEARKRAQLIRQQKELTYRALSMSLTYLKKYLDDKMAPVITKRKLFLSKYEGGWVIYDMVSQPGDATGINQYSTTSYAVLTESGLFGHASAFGTGYLLYGSAIKVSYKNINDLPDKYFSYRWGQGENWSIAWESIYNNVNLLLYESGKKLPILRGH
jgi:hypothetical protein